MLQDRKLPPGSFPPAAYEFIFAALNHVLVRAGERRHISGRELVDGVCELASREFDYLAPTVLEAWGLVRPQDLGRGVFQMVKLGILARREEDSPADFDLPLTLRQMIPRSHDHLSEIRGELAATQPHSPSIS